VVACKLLSRLNGQRTVSVSTDHSEAADSCIKDSISYSTLQIIFISPGLSEVFSFKIGKTEFSTFYKLRSYNKPLYVPKRYVGFETTVNELRLQRS
jgi:hypothetical protein